MKTTVIGFLNDLESNGFDGMEFEVDRYGQEDWTDDSCSFVLYVDLMELDRSQSPYTETKVDVDRLWNDIQICLSSKLPNYKVVKTDFGQQQWCCEYVVQRK